MSHDIKKVRVGDDLRKNFTAHAFNSFVDGLGRRDATGAVVSPDTPDFGVPFANASQETIPPYACMEVAGIYIVNDKPVFVVQKPTTRRDGQLWLVNKSAPVSPENDIINYGTWATEPSPVMMINGSVPGHCVTFAPAPGQWYVQGDPYSASGTSGPVAMAYGFRWCVFNSSGSGYVPTGGFTDYQFPYAEGTGALRYGIMQQLPEIPSLSRRYGLLGEGSGWTANDTFGPGAGGYQGWFSAGSSSYYAYRVGLAPTGTSDPGVDGTLVCTRRGWYRFRFSMQFNMSASVGAYSGSFYSSVTSSATALSDHVHSTSGADTGNPTTHPTHTHATSILDTQLWDYGSILYIATDFGAGAGTVFQSNYPLVRPGNTVYRSLLCEWEELCSEGEVYGVNLGWSETSGKITLRIDSAYLTVERLRDLEVAD